MTKLAATLTVATAVLLLALRAANAQPTPNMQSRPTIRVISAQKSQSAPAEYFTGSVELSGDFKTEAPARVGGATVTFSAGARTHWHTHPLGQTLVVTEGQGRVQQWGEPIQSMHKGDVITIPPGVKHWHGADQKTNMTHVAISESLDGKAVDWLEPVTNDQYRGDLSPMPDRQAPERQTPGTATQEPTIAQRNVGALAPKLAQITDDVLYADVWERPELSKRDRSLVTVATLIANGNTDQLRGHLQRAKDNGVTETELGEVLTHLAFYAGWPRAMSAAAIAKEVFKK